jgi:4a-hydroxytetrahydrobiopterin dehydratase
MGYQKLSEQLCVPCSGEEPPASKEQRRQWLSLLPHWEMVVEDDEPRLRRKYTFPDFKSALAFTNKIGVEAEKEGHHPVIQLTWGKVVLEWWTHEIGDVHQNDFIMAARSEGVYEAMQPGDQKNQG